MRNLGYAMVLFGAFLALIFLILGGVYAVPWNTACLVLFGCGISYSGLCMLMGVQHNELMERSDPQPRDSMRLT